MTKKILTILMALCFVLSVACAEKTPGPRMSKAIRIAEDGENLIQMTEEDLYDVLGIEPDEYTDFAYLTDHDSLSGREIILLRAKDEKAAEAVAEKLEDYRQYRLHMTQNYPDQAEAYRTLNLAEVQREDLLVVLSVAAPDPQEAGLLLQEE